MAITNSRQAGPALLFGYLAAVLITGALLAPVLWEISQWYVGMVKSFRLSQTPIIGWLAGKIYNSDFTRIYNRAFLVAALAWLVPFGKWANVRLEDLGLQKNTRRWKDATLGILLGALLLLAMGWAFMKAGRFIVNPKVHGLSVLPPAFFAAVCVALFEEFFFRGALFGFLLKTLSPWRAAVFLSAFFAILHLLQPPEDCTVVAPSWSSGLWMTGQILGKFGHASFLVAEFCTLFVVGWILVMARVKTNSLWLSIGLHAGWVLGIKWFGAVTRTAKNVTETSFMPWIGKDLKSGIAPLLVLAITGGIVWLWLAHFSKRDDQQVGC